MCQVVSGKYHKCIYKTITIRVVLRGMERGREKFGGSIWHFFEEGHEGLTDVNDCYITPIVIGLRKGRDLGRI